MAPRGSDFSGVVQQPSQAPRDQEGRIPRERAPARPPNVLYTVRRLLDPWLDTNAYTPAAIKSAFRSAEVGELWIQLMMYRRMIEMDCHLGEVVDKRRRGIRRARHIVRAPQGFEDDKAAALAVDYVRLVLRNLVGWPSALQRLMDGPILGFGAVEIEWIDNVPIALHQTADECWRWRGYGGAPSAWGVTPSQPSTSLPGGNRGLQVQDDTGRWQDVPADKFIVHSPADSSPVFVRRGAMRACSWPWVVKHFGVTDWATYIEVYGQPPRVFKHSRQEGDPLIAAVFEGLRAMGATGVAGIPDDVELIPLSATAAHGTSPHEAFIEWADRQMSKRILGQTLTSDATSATGTYSLGVVHQQGELELNEADAADIAETVRRDLLIPMVGYGLGWDVPVPELVLDVPNPARDRARAELLDIAINKLGIDVPAITVYSDLDIEPPKTVTKDSLAAGAPEPLPAAARRTADDQDVTEAVHRIVEAVGARLGVAANGAVMGEDDEALTALAIAGEKAWQKRQEESVMLAMAKMLEDNPSLTLEQAVSRLRWLEPTIESSDLQEALLHTLHAAAVNGPLAVDAEGQSA